VRTPLFEREPVPELRGLRGLTDPDAGVTAVIDLPILGARGDGKTQFIVHAIRTLRAHAPALTDEEQAANRAILRVVLDPRGPRSEATPPGVVPHYTFRVRAGALTARLGLGGAAALLVRATSALRWLALWAVVALAAGLVAAAVSRDLVPSLLVGGSVLALATVGVVLAARRALAGHGDLELVLWDVAGEQIYSAAAADYHALLTALAEARRRRAEALGRGYALAPILICNPLALGTRPSASAFDRLRRLLPLYAGVEPSTQQAMIAVNRWTVACALTTAGADRDEVVTVQAIAVDDEGRPHPGPAGPTGSDGGPPGRDVVRDVVREVCVDSEDHRDGEVVVRYLRYDAATDVELDGADGKLAYRFADGPGWFTGEAERTWIGWLTGLVRWSGPARMSPERVATAAAAGVDAPAPGQPSPLAATPNGAAVPTSTWGRPPGVG
jgi:hypothetical protein